MGQKCARQAEVAALRRAEASELSESAASLRHLLRFLDADTLGEVLRRKGYDVDEHLEVLVDMIRNTEKDGDRLRAHHELSRVVENVVGNVILQPTVVDNVERIRAIDGECTPLLEEDRGGALEEFLASVNEQNERRPVHATDADQDRNQPAYADEGQVEEAQSPHGGPGIGTVHRPPRDTGASDGGISSIRGPSERKLAERVKKT